MRQQLRNEIQLLLGHEGRGGPQHAVPLQGGEQRPAGADLGVPFPPKQRCAFRKKCLPAGPVGFRQILPQALCQLGGACPGAHLHLRQSLKQRAGAPGVQISAHHLPQAGEGLLRLPQGGMGPGQGDAGVVRILGGGAAHGTADGLVPELIRFRILLHGPEIGFPVFNGFCIASPGVQIDGEVIICLNPQIDAVGEFPFPQLRPVQNLRQAKAAGMGNSQSQQVAPHLPPAALMVFHHGHGMAQPLRKVRLLLGNVQILGQGPEILRRFRQAFLQKSKVPPPLGPTTLLSQLHITVVVEQGVMHEDNVLLNVREDRALMDGPLKMEPRHAAEQPVGQKIRIVCPEIPAEIVPDGHHAEGSGAPVECPLVKEIQKLGQIPVQPFIAVHHQHPLAQTAVQGRVPGSGKIPDPGEIHHLVGVPLRHLPAAVGGAGVYQHQLAGKGGPEPVHGAQAALQAADFILEKNCYGKQRSLFLHSFAPYIFSIILENPAFAGIFTKKGERAGARPPGLARELSAIP